MVIDKVRDTIKRYNMISENERIVLGLSGGPDSVCLFFVLRELGYQVHAVHVNHMMRQETAIRDEKFVRELCGSKGCECHVFTVDCNAKAGTLGISGEEAGRMARYDAFTQVANKLSSEGNKVCIAVAHNADDQAETALFRILRGTGIDGLAAMEAVRLESNYKVVRPLLNVTRCEIEEYLRSRSIEYMTDETNLEPIYTRNKIRLELLPLLRKEYNENVTDSLCRLAGLASVDKDYIWQKTEEAYQECLVSVVSSEGANCNGNEYHETVREVVLNQEKLAKLHPAIRNRVLLKCLRAVGLWQDVTNERLEAASNLINNGSATKVLELPHGYKMTFAFGQVKVKCGNTFRDGKKESREAPDRMNLEVNILDVSRINIEEFKSGTLFFDADKVANACNIPISKLCDKVNVRSRQGGDFIALNGGKKLIKKLMGEMRIPADERDDALLVAIGHCVLYIEALERTKKRYAEAFKVDDKTAQIITVKFV